MAGRDGGLDPGGDARRATMVARIGILRALNHGKPNPATAPRWKWLRPLSLSVVVRPWSLLDAIHA